MPRMCDVTVKRPLTDEGLLRYDEAITEAKDWLLRLGRLRSTGFMWICDQSAVANGKCEYHQETS